MLLLRLYLKPYQVSYTVDCNDNIDVLQAPCTTSYIDSIIEELDENDAENAKGKLEESGVLEGNDFLSDASALSISYFHSSSIEAFDDKEEEGSGIKSDPYVAKSGLLLNKDLLSKIKDLRACGELMFNKILIHHRLLT